MIFKKPKSNKNKNKKKRRGKKRNLAASAILSLHLLFGGPQLASSNSRTFQSGGNSKTQISKTLDQEALTQPKGVLQDSQIILDISSGQITISFPRGGEWQPKSGPGPRAKADARRNAQAGKFSSISRRSI